MIFSLWKISLLAALFTGSIAEHSVEETHHKLYDKAVAILSDIPQFTNAKNYNSDNKVVLNVPMDYSIEYQKSVNKEILRTMSSSQCLAYEFLQESSELGNVDASYTLADINFYGNYSYPKNGSEALKYYLQVSELKPNATAYFNIAFIYSTGLFGEVEIDQAKANLYYNFAFNQGDLRAGVVLGYRYLNGISVESNCRRSEFYYQSVADKLRDFYDNSPLGGPTLDSYSIRLSDFQGGVYGEGVDNMKSSLTRKGDRYDYLLSGSYSVNEEPVFDSLYWMIINEYEGSYLKKRNFTSTLSDARYVRKHALKQKDLIDIDKKYAARCIYILGRLYLRGEGVEQDYEKALSHFQEALLFAPLGEVYNDLGLIYEFGPESIQDNEKAGKYYKKANIATGVYNYGRWLVNNGNQTGLDYIEAASQYHDFQAVYSLNELSTGSQKFTCSASVSMLRFYIEKFDSVITSLEWSFFEMIYNRPENALIGYSMAAEQGFETAQSSAAYLLYQIPDLFEKDPPITTKERLEMAITYLTRSSLNSNVESGCVLGDLYCEIGEYEKASAAYDLAATRRSSQAHFNLGWLHEYGYGSKKDFNMAKRHYDLALSYNQKSYLIVKLALLKLRFKSFINDITGGKINGINQEDSENVQETPKGWAAWAELYKKVRDSNFRDEEETNIGTEATQDANDDRGIQYEDLVVVAFFLMVMFAFILFHYFSSRDRRMRVNGADVGGAGNAGNNGGFNFEFNVIAI